MYCFSLKISFIILIPFIFYLNFKYCTCQYYCMIFPQDNLVSIMRHLHSYVLV